MPTKIELIVPNWPIPANVRAYCSTRTGGVSGGPWSSLNLGDHVGDDPVAVTKNRAILQQAAVYGEPPVWLEQVHGIVIADNSAQVRADGRYSAIPGEVCAVLSADCLPVLLCSQDGTEVAAVHAGWKGLLAGVLESAVARFSISAEYLQAWLGPAIGPRAFQVGREVRDAFVAKNERAEAAFRRQDKDRWLADIYALARLRLGSVGVGSIYGGGYCTVSDPQRFYSYRRDGVTGRMASLIWIQEIET